MIVLGLDPGFASVGWAIGHYRRKSKAEKKQRWTLLGAGVITTKPNMFGKKKGKNDDAIDRMRFITREIDDLKFVPPQFKDLPRDEQLVKMEWLAPHLTLISSEAMSQGFKGGNAAVSLGRFWGILIAWAEINEKPLVTISPMALKLHATGTKTASKELVQSEMCKMFPELRPILDSYAKGKREHVADAVAAMFCSTKTDYGRMFMVHGGHLNENG